MDDIKNMISQGQNTLSDPPQPLRIRLPRAGSAKRREKKMKNVSATSLPPPPPNSESSGWGARPPPPPPSSPPSKTTLMSPPPLDLIPSDLPTPPRGAPMCERTLAMGASIAYRDGFEEEVTIVKLLSEFEGLYEEGNRRLPRKVFYVCENRNFLNYSYGTTSHRSIAEWPKSLRGLKAKVEAQCGVKFNAAVVNLYRDGRDSVGWHSDDEYGVHSTIASLSFGAERTFQMRPKGESRAAISVVLRNGSLLLMRGLNCQKDWEHSVPKDFNSSLKERVNVTFRYMEDIRRGYAKENPSCV